MSLFELVGDAQRQRSVPNSVGVVAGPCSQHCDGLDEAHLVGGFVLVAMVLAGEPPIQDAVLDLALGTAQIGETVDLHLRAALRVGPLRGGRVVQTTGRRTYCHELDEVVQRVQVFFFGGFWVELYILCYLYSLR